MYREGREGNPLSRESYPRYYRERLSRRDSLKRGSRQEEANSALSFIGGFGGDLIPPPIAAGLPERWVS
jgi:hypothetical protein